MTPHIDAAKAVKVAWDERRMLAAERGMKRKRLQRRVALSIAAGIGLLENDHWVEVPVPAGDHLVRVYSSGHEGPAGAATA